MKRILVAVATLGVVFATPASVGARPKLTPQQELDKMLEGRVAGKPVQCITLSDSQDTKVFDKTAIVYDAGSTIYVNRTTDPKSLDSDDLQVVKIWGSQLCRLDTIQLHDRTMGTWRGFVGLEDFVPYRKAPKAG